MIPFDFEYYKPTSVQKAVELFQYLQTQGKNPLYYSGGTEIITFARRNFIHPRAVVDLKAIPESNVTELQKDGLVIGSCISLSRLSASNLFPLLSEAAQGVADQTARNKITLGGNICGEIYYREAVLPLLLADSRMVIAGPEGIKVIHIHHVFLQRMRLEKNEFLLQTITDREYLTLPCIHFKKRQIGNVGYPLVSVAALKKEKQIRIAFSGVCAFPFRSIEIEQIVNNSRLSLAERIDQIIWNLPAPVLNNMEGSADYRTFVLKNTLFETVKKLEGR
ncbi:FAD binding domain-containing protein [Paenibacillus alginolyticus]|uniref:FAD binding domain-containing protein n=1 Tax=Paenibacillus alginolyticus TaxID=59839 RepID=A0ABT4G5E6_9BACL|nr:FAD binding domain-containing protein [Paenibacillus alginolyticus]MCY9669666.1 FAD binding domain-containing protein [Paenibacillus alginolyticus]MCY9691387.1 FAD binding domain-containing protein [Paenibacillus alginolyticus]MEC0146495.1 FAD binding domain-containing protein [Paenibacillus alginolyticus]